MPWCLFGSPFPMRATTEEIGHLLMSFLFFVWVLVPSSSQLHYWQMKLSLGILVLLPVQLR